MLTHVDNSLIDSVIKSELFDQSWYAAQTGSNEPERVAIQQYLLERDYRTTSPTPLFDANWYLDTYPDVAHSDMHPFVHFLKFGLEEGRKPGLLFDHLYYSLNYMDGETSYAAALQHYLREGRETGASCNAWFDANWYLTNYPDVADSEQTDLIAHYLLHGEHEGRRFRDDFDPAWYRARYPELLHSGQSVLLHVLDHQNDPDFRTSYRALDKSSGSSERRGWRQLAKYDVAKSRLGEQFQFHADRKIVIAVTHEMSRTGAPLIILNLVKYFSRLPDVEVITFADRLGSLEPEFRRYGKIVDFSRHNINDPDLNLADLLSELGPNIALAVSNTANTNHYTGAFRGHGIPTLNLVHEMLYAYPKKYVRELYSFCDRVVFPAQFVSNVANSVAKIPSNKAVVIPQGLLNPNFADSKDSDVRARVRAALNIPLDAVVVIGCGAVSMRKGVDLFVRVAREVLSKEKQIHFIWLGNQSVEAPFTYWIKKEISASGIESRFHMIEETSDPAPYYLASDIFALTSREDPFPCVVHEAMACNLSVVAFSGAGGATEALEGGTGFAVPFSDTTAMAQKITDLALNADLRRNIGEKAADRVNTEYKFSRYFSRILDLAGDVGAELPPFIESDQRQPRVIFFARDWWISGVNSFTETLIDFLIKNGVRAELVFPTFNEANRAHLPNVPTQFLDLSGTYAEQWERLKDFAKDSSPCILIPNYDYITSAIAPGLPSNVGMIGIIHSDDVEHYDHVQRIGRYWDAIVSSNHYLEGNVIDINPSFAKISSVIPYGVDVPGKCATRPIHEKFNRVELVYCGRLTRHQKRVQDLVRIVAELDKRSISYRLRVIGDGEYAGSLVKEWREHIEAGTILMMGRLSRPEMYQVFETSDIFLLVSEFEGMPIALLEAMAYGVVPVVTDIPSGIPELVTEDTGYRIPVGDSAGFAAAIASLVADSNLLRKRSEQAKRHIITGGYRTNDMGEHYLKLIHDVWGKIQDPSYRRPKSLVWGSGSLEVSPPTNLFSFYEA